MKILITGSHSFVGTNFINHSKFKTIEEVSLFNYEPGKSGFYNYDVILHLVAIVHQKATIPEAEYFRVNRDLTLQVAREAKQAGVKQFIFLSTVKVYGAFRTSSEPWNESSDCFPEDAYGRSKYEAEKEDTYRRIRQSRLPQGGVRRGTDPDPAARRGLRNLRQL